MATRTTYNLKDALLIKETAFPTAAGTVYSDAFDLNDIGERGVRTDAFELLINAPAVTAVALPASTSYTFSLQFCDAPDFTSDVTEVSFTPAWKQTGSASGANEFERRFRPMTDAPRYARVKCVTAGETIALTGTAFQFAIVS